MRFHKTSLFTLAGLVLLLAASGVFLARGTMGSPAPDIAPDGGIFVYSAKFVCGTAVDEPAVVDGDYATAVNVHNPSNTDTATLQKKAVRALPEDEPQEPPGELVEVELGPDYAFEIDCADIATLLPFTPPLFYKGFVVIHSSYELDVVALYTTTATIAPIGIGLDLDIERIPAQIVAAEEPPAEADLEKVDLQVKPFYCGDSDGDAYEDEFQQGTSLGRYECCNGIDDDGDTYIDALDGNCGLLTNQDGAPWGQTDDWDDQIDEDPDPYPSGQTCPWNGDDDCDGAIDEDPKNDIDDDGDCPNPQGDCSLSTLYGGCMEYCDEDPANGFLGFDNDRDGLVDEDGAGRFDFNGNTMIDYPCTDYPGGLLCEDQGQGVDDDGDTQVDEDPLDSPMAVWAEEAGDIKYWEQSPDLYETGMDVSAVYYKLADDFLCTDSSDITWIEFWGSWEDDDKPGGNANNVSFYLSIHDNVLPNGFSHPGQELWSYQTAVGECYVGLYQTGVYEDWLSPPDHYWPDADQEVWFYSCFIPDGQRFPQQEGNVYWLDIQAFPTEEAYFGWKTAEYQWNDNAVYYDPTAGWQPLWYPDGHPWAEDALDLAFRILGESHPPHEVYEPHYLVKEILLNRGPEPWVAAIDTKEIDAPNYRVDALEDGKNTCNDLLDNDGDQLVDADDPDCLQEHLWAESGLHACSDGLDNGMAFAQPDGLVDAADPDCQSLTEVSVECNDPDDVITIKEGVDWYVKPPSTSDMLLGTNCEAYHTTRTEHYAKCVPCKIYMGTAPEGGESFYCADVTQNAPGYCIAADSTPGVYKELDIHQDLALPIDELVYREHQFDLSCEGETSLHKFIIQNEIWPIDATELNEDNNMAEMEMLVACMEWEPGDVDNLVVPDPNSAAGPPNKWDVDVSTSEIQTVTVDVTHGTWVGGEWLEGAPYPSDFILDLFEISPGLGVANLGGDSDGDGWADLIEQPILVSLPATDPEGGWETGADCTGGNDEDGDTFFDADDAGCQTPENQLAPGTCSDGLDNDKNGLTDSLDPKCWDRDGDGYSYVYEDLLFNSDDMDPTKTPEIMQFPWTCNDGIDNDKDGKCDDVGGCGTGMDPEPDDNGDGAADCSPEQLKKVPPPVACASGWVPQAGDTEYVWLMGDGTLVVGLKIPLDNLYTPMGPLTVSRDLVLHCFQPANPYPPELIYAYMRPAGVHEVDLYTTNDFALDTFDGVASCPDGSSDLDILAWDFDYDVSDFHTFVEETVSTNKNIHSGDHLGPLTGQDVDVLLEKWMNIPPGCDGSLTISKSETVVIPEDVWYTEHANGHEATFPDDWLQGPATLTPGNGSTVYVRGLDDPDSAVEELGANYYLTLEQSTNVWEDEVFDIYCREPTDPGEDVVFAFRNFLSHRYWPDECDPNISNNTATHQIVVEVPMDSDGDTVPDDSDNCVYDFNPGQENTDEIVNPPGDGAGDACDCDDDNGGTPDNQEDRDGTLNNDPLDDMALDMGDDDGDGALNWEEDWCGTDPFDDCGDDCGGAMTDDAWAYDINMDCWANATDDLMYPANINVHGATMPVALGVHPTYQCRYDLNGDSWVNATDRLMFPARVPPPGMPLMCTNP